MNLKIGTYAKALLAILAAGLVVLAAAITDDDVSSPELVNVGIAIVTAIGVYLIPNLPEGRGVRGYAKGAVAFLGAALAALASFLSDGVTNAEWVLIALAALGAIGVTIVPNTTANAPGRHEALAGPAV